MRTGLITAALVAGVVAGAASFAAAQEATPVSSGDLSSGLRFDVVFNDTFVLADESAGPQLGDRVILNDDLLIDGEVVGHTGGVCTITDVEGEMLCLVTFALPEGTISTQFLNTPPPEKLFPILGGTGAYENAGGHGELVEAGDGTGTLEFFVTE